MRHASSRDGSLVLLFALAALPLAAQAQVYKCRQADGSTTFQQVPCPQARPAAPAARDPREHVAPPPSADHHDDPYAGDPRSRPQRAASLPPGLEPARPAPPPRTAADLPRATNSSIGISGSTPLPGNYRPLPGSRDERILGQLDALQKESERLQAFNKRERCEHAKQQLEVAKAEMPIFSRDTNGDRHYIEDRDRAANTAARRREVQAECN